MRNAPHPPQHGGVVNLSRRAFLRWTGTAMVCTCATAILTSGCGDIAASDTPSAPAGSFHARNGSLYVTLSELGELLSVGGAVKCEVEFGDGPPLRIILVRPGQSDYRAFADACTHNGKELDYVHREGVLACCGRSSRFDLEGKVIRGPAEDALPRYAVRVEEGQLVIEF